jgi:hypothetical protein
MIALPYDYYLIAWFVLAAASTAYVAFDRNPRNESHGRVSPRVPKRS